MIASDEFARLLELIYAAVEEPEGWSEFLEQGRIHMGARSGSLILLDQSDFRMGVEVTAQIDPKLGIEMRDWGQRDIWLQNSVGKPVWEPGSVVPSQAVLPDEVVLKSAYYNEYVRRLGISQVLGCLLLADRRTVSSLNLYYAPDAGLRTPEQIELAHRLVPHLQRALRLHQRLGELEQSEAALTVSFDSLGPGFALLNESGELLRMNSAAEVMLRWQDGLVQRNRRLAATVSREDSLLRALVQAAAKTTLGTGASSGGAVRITRPSGKTPFTVTVMPVSHRGQLFDLHQARVVALIGDPESVPLPGTVALQRLFGFSAAEAGVAELLMEGLDRQEIADRLSVSLNTIRTHLRSLFSKTSTSRQAKLVQLLLVTTRTVPHKTR